MEPPLISRGCGLGHRRRAARPGGSLSAPNRCAPLIENCRARRKRRHTFGLCVKSYFAPNGDQVQVKPCSRASRRRVRFGPTQAPRQNASLAFGVCHLTLLLSSRPVTGVGGAFPTASGFGRFPPFAGERKTLTNP